MRFFSVLLLMGLLTCVQSIGAQDATAQSCSNSATSKFADERWNNQELKCELKEYVTIDATVSYPQALAQVSPLAKSTMLDYINQERYKFWLSTTNTIRPEDEFHGWTMSLEIKSDVYQHSADVVSVLFTRLYYEGPGLQTELQTYTFDLRTNRVLTLQDIFVEGIDPYTTVAPLVLDELKNNKQGYSSIDAVVSATIPIPENYKNWALTDKSLVFFYPGWAFIAPKADTQIVEIPLAALPAVIRPEFLVRP